MTTISLITPKRLLLIAAALMLTLAFAAAAPALSRADVYCVHQAGFTCSAGSVDEGSQLQNALNDAAGNPSTASSPNVITIGPGTYEPRSAGSGFSALTQYPLQVRGSGVGQTTLTDSARQAVIRLDSDSAPNRVSLSGVTVGGSGSYGVFVTNGNVEHVAVEPSGPDTSREDGIVLGGATMVKDSTVTLPAGSSGSGLVVAGGDFSSNEIDDVTVDGGNYGVIAFSGAVIHGARLIGSAISLVAQSAPVYIDDSLLVGGGVQALDNDGNEGSVQAVNDTIVSDGRAPAGVSASPTSAAGANVTIYNSIVHGFPTSFETGGPNSTIEAANDAYDSTTLQLGSTITVTGRVMGDPAFVDPGAGDYRLAWNSPLIDAGDTGLLSATSSTTDLGGNPREVRSSAGSSSPLDVGAYEYQHSAPVAAASATPTSAAIGTAIAFNSRASDPDDGDTLTYAWSFDDGATATGATVTHAFSAPGVHTATLTVTDPTGLSTKQTTQVTVSSPPAVTPPTPPTPPVPPTHPTGITSSPAPPHLVVLGKPSVNGNKVTLKLVCTGSTSCTGIQVTETANKTEQVASARLSVKPGQTKAITVALNGKGKRLLAHLGRLRVVITVTLKTATVKTAHVTLHAPKKPTHHHP